MTTARAAKRARTPEREAHAALRTWLRMLTCSNLVEREVRRRLRDGFGITLPRFDVLAQLGAGSRQSVRGLTMSELSRRLMVTNGNLTGVIERLVQEGLVSRAASPADRRTQIVRLTAQGRRVLDEMTPAHEEWIDMLFRDMTADDMTHFYALLGKLRGCIRKSVAAAALS